MSAICTPSSLERIHAAPPPSPPPSPPPPPPPSCIPHGRAIIARSKRDRIPYLAAAAAHGRHALLPYLTYILRSNPRLKPPLHGANEALLAAVSRDCEQSVEALILSAGANPFVSVHAFKKSSSTATHVAAARAKSNALAAILRLDPLCNATSVVDPSGFSPVHVAAVCGHTHIVKQFVLHDAAALLVRVQNTPLEECEYFASTEYDGVRDWRESETCQDDLFGRVWGIVDECTCYAAVIHIAALLGHVQMIYELLRLAYVAECAPPVRVLNRYHTPLVMESQQLCFEDQRFLTLETNLHARELADAHAHCVSLHRLQTMAVEEREKGRVQQRGDEHEALRKEVFTFVDELLSCSAEDTVQNFRKAKHTVVSIRVEQILEARNDFDQTPLFHAIQKGNCATFRSLVDLGVDLYARGYLNRSALHYAVEDEQLTLLDTLVTEFHLDIEARDAEGYTPLHHAVTLSRPVAAIEKLASLGADVNAKTFNDDTVLQLACNMPNHELVPVLLNLGADGNVICGTSTRTCAGLALANFGNVLELLENAHTRRLLLNIPSEIPNPPAILAEAIFHHASAHVVRDLLADGADINATNGSYDLTPLMLAAKSRSPEIVQILLDAGADVNSKDCFGWSALHNATLYNTDIDCMRLLIKRDADVNATADTDEASTALHIAAENGSVSKIRLLLVSGASPDLVSGYGATALQKAIRSGYLNAAKALIEGGASVSMRTWSGTVLHDAVETRCGDVLRILCLLLDNGCAIDFRKGDGETPLHWASCKSHKSLAIQILLARGADVNAVKRNGNTPLHCAASRGKSENVCMLMECGADINLKNGRGNDPLLCAALDGSLKVLIMLENHGASWNTRNLHNRSALYLAASSGNSAIVQYLLKCGAGAFDTENGILPSNLVVCAAGHPGTVKVLLEQNNSPLNFVSPKSVFIIHSPCESSDDLPEDLMKLCREERHERCELDFTRETCPICRELFRNGQEVRTFPCDHVFHAECVLSWLCSYIGSIRLKCPTCRQRIWTKEEDEGSYYSSDD